MIDVVDYDGDVREDTQEKGVREEGGNFCLSLSDIWKNRVPFTGS